MDSILIKIKESVNVDATDDSFDQQILLPINGCIFKLRQLGFSIPPTFEVVDDKQTWQEGFGDYPDSLPAIKQYMRDTTRLEFDPPTSSFAIAAIKDRIHETEWRLNTQVEGGTTNGC